MIDKSYDWTSFLIPADEWFITYANPPAFPSVKLFQIGHTVELYLKATYTQQTGDIEQTIKLGHNLKGIWDEIKRIDPSFLPGYEIRENIFQSDFMHNHAAEFGNDDQDHYFRNAEFYFITKHLADIKYLGAPLKTLSSGFTTGFQFPNEYWIYFIKQIRTYLGFPLADRLDEIRLYVEDRNELMWMHPYAIPYLKKMFD